MAAILATRAAVETAEGEAIAVVAVMIGSGAVNQGLL
jgi:hypothetical protein